jgi:hypothetical protein
MSYPYRYGIPSLLLNDHGKKFLDAECSESSRGWISTRRDLKSIAPTRRRDKGWRIWQGLRRRERQIDRDGAALQPIIGHI